MEFICGFRMSSNGNAVIWLHVCSNGFQPIRPSVKRQHEFCILDKNDLFSYKYFIFYDITSRSGEILPPFPAPVFLGLKNECGQFYETIDITGNINAICF